MWTASGIHRPNGLLCDPSAAIALLWMRRTLQFLSRCLRGLLDRDANMTDVAAYAYRVELEPFHGWLLKNSAGPPQRPNPRRVPPPSPLHPPTVAATLSLSPLHPPTVAATLSQPSEPAACNPRLLCVRPLRPLPHSLPHARARAAPPRPGLPLSRFAPRVASAPAAFTMALNGMPRRDEIVERLGGHLAEDERDRKLCLEVGECIEMLREVTDCMRALFEELDLEDTRKV